MCRLGVLGTWGMIKWLAYPIGENLSQLLEPEFCLSVVGIFLMLNFVGSVVGKKFGEECTFRCIRCITISSYCYWY